MAALRTLPWDWYPGTIPENVRMDETAHLDTSYSLLLFRSEQPIGAELGKASSVSGGTMFDVGPRGKLSIGEFALLNGAWIVCDREIVIGAHSLIAWNVVLMDTYRVPRDIAGRRRALLGATSRSPRRLEGEAEARPIRIGRNVWIGFGACVMPGVVIGEGSVVGARSVVFEEVPPFTLVAGNPARPMRKLEPGGHDHGL